MGIRVQPLIAAVAALFVASVALLGQTVEQPTATESVPVATRWVLDAAGEVQRNSITSVYLLLCPKTQKKGTGFLLMTGMIVTNEHVVRGCVYNEMEAVSPLGNTIRFTKLATDPDRDLALLRPAEKLIGGLELGADVSPVLGTAVSTWGFPLVYNGPAPLLSVGYVAGYNAVKIGARTVKHIVVNGAFNPGNSGGPVFIANDNKVVGVVVWKQRLLSQLVPKIITGLKHPRARIITGTFSFTMPDGTVRPASNDEAVALVLEEFYDTVQVMIGEAIAVSELKAFIASQQQF
ncbi:MAG: trypsin-like peptidase domain-containing protein [Acidobacteria bacterium]|nr:trypsin-like peptidase domain-containing protein [Acidobacteriota bacterium]